MSLRQQDSVTWRRTCPEEVSRRMERALEATLYILHQTGPVGFVVKQEGVGKKHKVFLGQTHSCTCSAFRKEKELCIHILWILLKKFRLSKENQLVYQLGLVEREVNELLQGVHKTASPASKEQEGKEGEGEGEGKAEASCRQILEEDVCPICQEELMGKPLPLTYCRFGCGKSIHIKCMKIWAEHQKATGETVIKCPLCREDFGPFEDLCKQMHTAHKLRPKQQQPCSKHPGVTCRRCHASPITGECYRCTQCSGYTLCKTCFVSEESHRANHKFESKQRSSQPWRVVSPTPTFPPSPSPRPLPLPLITSLQNRSFSEQDYELLLQLDHTTSASSSQQQQHHQAVPRKVLNSFPVEPLQERSRLVQERQVCRICMGAYRRGDWVRRLPCHHQFHRECIDTWLSSQRSNLCPEGGCPVMPPSNASPHTTNGMAQQQPKAKTARGKKKKQQQQNASSATEVGMDTPRRPRGLNQLSRHCKQQEGDRANDNVVNGLQFGVSGHKIARPVAVAVVGLEVKGSGNGSRRNGGIPELNSSSSSSSPSPKQQSTGSSDSSATGSPATAKSSRHPPPPPHAKDRRGLIGVLNGRALSHDHQGAVASSSGGVQLVAQLGIGRLQPHQQQFAGGQHCSSTTNSNNTNKVASAGHGASGGSARRPLLCHRKKRQQQLHVLARPAAGPTPPPLSALAPSLHGAVPSPPSSLCHNHSLGSVKGTTMAINSATAAATKRKPKAKAAEASRLPSLHGSHHVGGGRLRKSSLVKKSPPQSSPEHESYPSDVDLLDSSLHISSVQLCPPTLPSPMPISSLPNITGLGGGGGASATTTASS